MEGGWHPDPSARFELRYWDGSRWTEHVSTRGQQSRDALGETPPTSQNLTAQQSDPVASDDPRADSTQQFAQVPEAAVASPPRRPWYKRTGPVVVLALVLLVVLLGVIGAIAGGDKTNVATESTNRRSVIAAPRDTAAATTTTRRPRTTTTRRPRTTTTRRPRTTETLPPGTTGKYHNPGALFPARADQQNEDQERLIGQGAQLSGYTAIVRQAAFQQNISEFQTNGYVVASVSVENRDQKAQPYNVFDWKIQTPSGQVIDPTFTSDNQLGSGDLVGGGKVSGNVVFEVGAAKGDFFIIYKPDPFDASRGIWKVTV